MNVTIGAPTATASARAFTPEVVTEVFSPVIGSYSTELPLRKKIISVGGCSIKAIPAPFTVRSKFVEAGMPVGVLAFAMHGVISSE